MFALSFFSSASSLASTQGNQATPASALPGALAAQVAFEAKTPKAVIAAARAIMAMPEPNQQQACLVSMGFDEDKADELLDAIADLQERGVDLANYPTLRDVIDEMFHRLDVYAKIAGYDEDVNPDLLLEVSQCLKEETLAAIKHELSLAWPILRKQHNVKREKGKTKKLNLDAELVAYLPFTYNPDDISVYHNNVMNYGAILSSDRTGHPGSAYQFNGDTYIQISNIYFDMSYSSFTISTWSKRSDTLDEQGTIIATGGSGWAQGLVLQHRNDGFWGEVSDGVNEGVYISSNSLGGLYDSKWHHFVLVIDRENGVASGYIDGKQVASARISGEGNIHRAGTPINIGRLGQFSPVPQFHHGFIDEVCIYNRALNTHKVAALYQRDLQTPPPTAECDTTCAESWVNIIGGALGIATTLAGATYAACKFFKPAPVAREKDTTQTKQDAKRYTML